MSLTRLTEVLETDTRWLNNLLEGEQHQVSVQQNKTAQKLTWLDLKLPVGATRRLQALALAGWSLARITTETNIDPVRLARIQEGSTTNVSAQEFDQIWATTKRLASVYPKTNPSNKER